MPRQTIIINTEPLPDAETTLLSDDVQEIISRQPGWIVRNGMMLLLAIIVLFAGSSFFIHYPDAVAAHGRLASVNAPGPVIAHTGGMLVRLWVKEGQEVAQNEVIGCMESRAVYEQVTDFSAFVDTLRQLASGNPGYLPEYNAGYDMGELQPACQVFMQALSTYRQYLSSGFYAQKKKMLQTDIRFQQRQYTALKQQKNMQQEMLLLAGQNYEANKQLSDNHLIAASEYRDERSKYLSRALAIPQLDAGMINNENTRHDKQKELLQLDNETSMQKEVFLQALATMKAQLDEWKRKYLLLSPVRGRVFFEAVVMEKMQVKEGQVICYVNPANTVYYAVMMIRQDNFGKIKTGQQVLLKLPAYPYREFGLIKGRLDFISGISTDSGFVACVALPGGLITSYKKQLQYRDGLMADAEIITQDVTIGERMFNRLRSVTANH